MRIFEKSMPHNAEAHFPAFALKLKAAPYWSHVLSHVFNGPMSSRAWAQVPQVAALCLWCEGHGQELLVRWSCEVEEYYCMILYVRLLGGASFNMFWNCDIWHICRSTNNSKEGLKQPTNSKTALNHAGLSDLDQVDSNDQALGMSQAALTLQPLVFCIGIFRRAGPVSKGTFSKECTGQPHCSGETTTMVP